MKLLHLGVALFLSAAAAFHPHQAQASQELTACAKHLLRQPLQRGTFDIARPDRFDILDFGPARFSARFKSRLKAKAGGGEVVPVTVDLIFRLQPACAFQEIRATNEMTGFPAFAEPPKAPDIASVPAEVDIYKLPMLLGKLDPLFERISALGYSPQDCAGEIIKQAVSSIAYQALSFPELGSPDEPGYASPGYHTAQFPIFGARVRDLRTGTQQTLLGTVVIDFKNKISEDGSRQQTSCVLSRFRLPRSLKSPASLFLWSDSADLSQVMIKVQNRGNIPFLEKDKAYDRRELESLFGVFPEFTF